MSNLIVLGFNNEQAVFEMRAALARMQGQYLRTSLTKEKEEELRQALEGISASAPKGAGRG